MFGIGRRLPREKIRQLYDKGWFISGLEPSTLIDIDHSTKKPLTIDEMKQI
jgi:hypothetical protein